MKKNYISFAKTPKRKSTFITEFTGKLLIWNYFLNKWLDLKHPFPLEKMLKTKKNIYI